MSAFICSDKTINNVANSLNHIAEYGQYNVYSTQQATKKLLRDLRVKKLGSINSGIISSLESIYDNTQDEIHGQANESAKAIAEKLYELNVLGVNSRYNEDDPIDFDGFKNTIPVSNIQLLKSLRCIIYQCSEGDVPENPFFKHFESISMELAFDIVTSSKEYDAANWD